MNALVGYQIIFTIFDLHFSDSERRNKRKRGKPGSAWRIARRSKPRISRNVSGWELEKRSPKPFNPIEGLKGMSQFA